MQTKLLEVRDHTTRIPVLAMAIGPDSEAAAALLRRCGLTDSKGVVILNLKDQTAQKDFCGWKNSPTMATAHAYIDGRFDKLSDGDVVDVEYILGDTPKLNVEPPHETWRSVS